MTGVSSFRGLSRRCSREFCSRGLGDGETIEAVVCSLRV